jgi:hypothetical protein
MLVIESVSWNTFLNSRFVSQSSHGQAERRDTFRIGFGSKLHPLYVHRLDREVVVYFAGKSWAHCKKLKWNSFTAKHFNFKSDQLEQLGARCCLFYEIRIGSVCSRGEFFKRMFMPTEKLAPWQRWVAHLTPTRCVGTNSNLCSSWRLRTFQMCHFVHLTKVVYIIDTSFIDRR